MAGAKRGTGSRFLSGFDICDYIDMKFGPGHLGCSRSIWDKARRKFQGIRLASVLKTSIAISRLGR